MPEKQNVEWKRTWKDEILKWICGFANAQGGTIYIGKSDDGQVYGLNNSKKLMEDIPNKIRDILGIIVDVNMHTEDGKEYIEIIVNSSSYPISYYGEYHYRAGSTKQLLKGQALNEFLLKKSGMTWDSMPISGVSVADLRNDSFDIFREQAVRSKRMTEEDINVSNEQLLDNLGLIEDGMLRRAAILLFHHNPEKWVQGAYIKIGFFESDADILYQDEIHGSLISQAERVIDLLYTKYMRAEISYEGDVRVETYPYPRAAIREAVYNAIGHKLYSMLTPIQISVYEDRLYIANDSALPEDLTEEEFLGKHKSRPYNPFIANTFFRAGFIESWGRGIEKIMKSCREAGNPEPKFKLKKEDIMIEFKSLVNSSNQATNQGGAKASIHGKDRTNQGINQGDENLDLNPIERRILSVILEEPNFSQKKIADMTGIKYSSVKYKIEKLKEKGIIKRVGTSQNGYWKILK